MRQGKRRIGTRSRLRDSEGVVFPSVGSWPAGDGGPFVDEQGPLNERPPFEAHEISTDYLWGSCAGRRRALSRERVGVDLGRRSPYL